MSLRYLLDTNICIYIAKQHPISVLEKFEKLTIGEVGMSTITYGELLHGAQKSQFKKKTTQILKELATLIIPLPIPTNAAEYYDTIRSSLESKGNIIGNNDLWIAAHALSLGAILVTNNVKEFARIPKLKIENWVK